MQLKWWLEKFLWHTKIIFGKCFFFFYYYYSNECLCEGKKISYSFVSIFLWWVKKKFWFEILCITKTKENKRKLILPVNTDLCLYDFDWIGWKEKKNKKQIGIIFSFGFNIRIGKRWSFYVALAELCI